MSARPLVVGQRIEPLFEAGGDGEVAQSGFGGELGVAGPAVFFAVRAVEGNPDEVAAIRLPHGELERIEVVVRRLEIPRVGKGGMHELRRDGLQLRFAAAIDLAVLEAVEGEPRRPLLPRRIAAEDVAVALALAGAEEFSDMLLVHPPVREQPFAVTQFDRVPGPAAHPDPAMPGKVDAEIRHQPPRFKLPQRNRADSPHDPARRRGLFFEDSSRRSELDRRFPCRIVEAVFTPAGHFQPGIVSFPLPKRVEPDRPLYRHPPAVRIAAQNLPPAVP
ncbi:hypothetical protein SDC9_153387 [bioreactor metagenome]|uniref:Uncharacterized protein n=1 Tax=bioreactor metagenome TaxID=1076179 RepID=A0A645EY09_9ZZZZ